MYDYFGGKNQYFWDLLRKFLQQQIFNSPSNLNKDISLEIALPCKDHNKKWSYKQKCRLSAILEVADKVKYVTETEYKKVANNSATNIW